MEVLLKIHIEEFRNLEQIIEGMIKRDWDLGNESTKEKYDHMAGRIKEVYFQLYLINTYQTHDDIISYLTTRLIHSGRYLSQREINNQFYGERDFFTGLESAINVYKKDMNLIA